MSAPGVVVAGATGLVGAAAVDAALAAGWRVAALARPGRLEAGRENLEIVETDYESLPGIAARLRDFQPTAILCALGTTIRTAGSQAAFARVDREYVAALAALGRLAGASRFGLVSAVGADPASRNFYLRTKGEAEAAVRGAGYARVEIARPSFLTGPRRESRIGEAVAIPVATLLAPLLVGGLSIYRPIAAATVARALVRGLGSEAPGVFVRHFRDLTALAGA